MSYLGELRISWRYATAATIGLASGYMLNHYITGIFAPEMIAEFKWPREQFALIGLSFLIGGLIMPIAGRLTDIFGTRPMATVGVILFPLSYVALSMQPGHIGWFFLLNILQLVLIGSTTTSMVYSRLIAVRFRAARGLALSLAASAPPLVAAVCSPLLTEYMQQHGWRAAYLVVAVSVAIGGAFALILIPKRGAEEPPPPRLDKKTMWQDFPVIIRNRTFLIIIAGKYLCTMSTLVQAAQLKLVFIDKGNSSATASWLLSLYAIGVVIGRLTSGLALDRWPSHIVAAIVFGVPSIGLFIIGTSINDSTILAAAVLTLGVSTGAELDVAAYLVMRYFKVEIYSTVYSLTMLVVGLSAVSGTLLLSGTLKISGGFGLFYMIAAAITLGGSLFFLMLGRQAALENDELSR